MPLPDLSQSSDNKVLPLQSLQPNQDQEMLRVYLMPDDSNTE